MKNYSGLNNQLFPKSLAIQVPFISKLHWENVMCVLYAFIQPCFIGVHFMLKSIMIHEVKKKSK